MRTLNSRGNIATMSREFPVLLDSNDIVKVELSDYNLKNHNIQNAINGGYLQHSIGNFYFCKRIVANNFVLKVINN